MLNLSVNVKLDLTGELGGKVRKKVGRVVAKATEDTAADYKARIADNTGKSGHVYELRDGIEHQASAPGQAPANRYGELAENITFDVSEAESELTGVVQAFKEYAPVLELGGENVAARPALQPALDAMADVLPQALEAAVNSVVSQ